jgi:hypothetical protein
MKPTFITYYNNQKLENKHSDNLARSIFELGLKKGDTITSYSFNHFDDEDSKFKPEKASYQDIELKIEDIKIKLIDTWNSSIKSTVEIFLIERLT